MKKCGGEKWTKVLDSVRPENKKLQAAANRVAAAVTNRVAGAQLRVGSSKRRTGAPTSVSA